MEGSSLSLRRLGILVLGAVGAIVVTLVAAIRLREPDAAVDTAATFGFLTLVVFQISKLAGGEEEQ